MNNDFFFHRRAERFIQTYAVCMDKTVCDFFHLFRFGMKIGEAKNVRRTNRCVKNGRFFNFK